MRINYDMIPQPIAFNGDKYLSHFSDEYSSFQFVFTHRYKTDSVRYCKYIINLISTQFNIKVRYFHVNRETSLGKEQTKYNEF